MCEFLISSLHSTCSVYFMCCNLVIPIICGKIKMFLELRLKFVVKMLCTWFNLVILKVLPARIYTLALKVLLLLKEPLKILYWYCCETVVVFCWFSSTDAKWKHLSLILSLGNRYKLHDLENRWLRDGWNSVILQKLLHSAGSVTTCNTRVQDPIITQFFCPLWINSIHPNAMDQKLAFTI